MQSKNAINGKPNNIETERRVFHALSCGTVAANSRWQTYRRPTGPMSFDGSAHSPEAWSFKNG
jgi:hypothetical protein